MPNLSTVVTTTSTVTLSPTVSAQVLNKLREYESNALAIKALEADQAALKVEIDGVLNDAGEAHALEGGIEVEGYKAKMVHPTRDQLDTMKLISMGVTTAQLAEATRSAPTKSYLLISSPRVPKAK